jgi:hypothetical protein
MTTKQVQPHRFLRESQNDRSDSIVDSGFGRGSGDNGGRGGLHEGKGYFWMNGKNWTSETHFVRGGGRCKTERLSNAQRAQHAADLKNFRDRAGYDDRRLQVVTNTINVNWVVISHTNGAGALTQTQIDSQINVLNAAFKPQFRFAATVKRVVHDDLFTCTFNNEWTISQTYGVRDPTVLNLYTCFPPGYLGWSRYPSGGIAGSVWDLAVVAHNSVPGGNLGVYSYGHVSSAERNRNDFKRIFRSHSHLPALFSPAMTDSHP